MTLFLEANTGAPRDSTPWSEYILVFALSCSLSLCRGIHLSFSDFWQSCERASGSPMNCLG